MSIATEITRIANAKSSIKSAIESKGITVSSDAKIDTYGSLVSSIPQGFFSSIKVTGTSQSDTVSASKDGKTKTATWVGESRLPSGYTEVEYIEFTGTQYINTNITMKSSSGIHTKYSSTSIPSAELHDVFGYQSTSSGQYFSILRDESRHMAETYSGVNTGLGDSDINTVYDVYINYLNDAKVVSNSVVKSSSISLATDSTYGNIYLGADNLNGNVERFFLGHIYETVFTEASDIVRDFVPCKNSSDEYGMYDLVSNQFFGNSGTGSFTGGPVACYHLISQIDEMGTWVLSITRGGVTKTQNVLIDSVEQIVVDVTELGRTYLYNLGDECTSLTGGWGYCWADSSYKNGYVTRNSDNISFGDNSSAYGNPAMFNKTMVDLTNYSSVHCIVDINNVVNAGGYKCFFAFNVSNVQQINDGTIIGSYVAGTTLQLDTGDVFSDREFSLDISSLSGNHEVILYPFSHYYNNMTINCVMKKVWLE